MLRPIFKSEVAELLQQLEKTAGGVPERARSWHERRRLVGDEMAAENRRYWPFFVQQHRLAELHERVHGLCAIADRLTGLLRRGDEVAERVRALDALDAADAETAAWLHDRCREWHAVLARVGDDAAGDVDIQRYHARIDEVERPLPLYDQALARLREARDLRATLGDLGGASLDAELPRLRQALFGGGPTPQWLDEMRTLLAPQREAAERLQTPPEQLRALSPVMGELRGWADALGQLRAQVEELEKKRGRFTVEWGRAGDEEVQALLDGARRLLEDVVEQAREVRARRLAEMEEQLRGLVEACGPQPELEHDLDRLRREPVARHQQYRQWMYASRDHDARFRNIATTHRGQLEDRLVAVVKGQRERLKALREGLLSEALRTEADGVETDLVLLESLQGDDLLPGLRRAVEVESRLAALEVGARHERRQLEDECDALRARHAALREAAHNTSMGTPDLSPRFDEIAVLFAGRDGRDTGSLRERLDRLRAESEQYERDYVEKCAKEIDLGAAQARDRRRVLEAARVDLRGIDSVTALDSRATAQQAAAALEKATDILKELLHLCEQTAADFDRRRQDALARLERVPLDSLAPPERETAERLMQDAREGAWTSANDDVERLHGLVALREDCEHFFDKLLHEEKAARARIAELKKRLAELEREHLAAYQPQWVTRATALVHGIPATPPSWSVVSGQLEQAEDLVARIEIHARRLAAAEVERHVKELRAPRGQRRETAATLLKEVEVEAGGHQRLPRAALRRRLAQSAEHGQRRKGHS